MRWMLLAALTLSLALSLNLSTAFAQETCESKAVSKEGKPPAGAAKTSFLKKCKRDTCQVKGVGSNGRALAGAAKKSFMQKCQREEYYTAERVSPCIPRSCPDEPSHLFVVRDIEHNPARLAVHGVIVVPLQAAVGTLEKNLARLKQGAGQVQKQRDSAHHDDDRDHAPRRALQCDVAEAGRRQRSDGEIEGVRVVDDQRVPVMLGLVHDRRHHEDEDEKIRACKDYFFIALEERAVLAKSFEQLIGVEQS